MPSVPLVEDQSGVDPRWSRPATPCLSANAFESIACGTTGVPSSTQLCDARKFHDMDRLCVGCRQYRSRALYRCERSAKRSRPHSLNASCRVGEGTASPEVCWEAHRRQMFPISLARYRQSRNYGRARSPNEAAYLNHSYPVWGT